MKMQTTKFLSPLHRDGIIKLSTEVKEILEPDFKKNAGRILSNADLWNIQRNQRTRHFRKYL